MRKSVLIVAEKSPVYIGGKRYALIIAAFELGTISKSLVGTFEESDYFIFPSSLPSEKITEDRFGNPLMKATLSDAIIWVRDLVRSDKRTKILAMLKYLTYMRTLERDLVILHYQY